MARLIGTKAQLKAVKFVNTHINYLSRFTGLDLNQPITVNITVGKVKFRITDETLAKAVVKYLRTKISTMINMCVDKRGVELSEEENKVLSEFNAFVEGKKETEEVENTENVEEKNTEETHTENIEEHTEGTEESAPTEDEEFEEFDEDEPSENLGLKW